MSEIKEYEAKYSGYIDMLRTALSKKRFSHSMNVAAMCFDLAKKHGSDAEKAYLAGILHDIRKETEDKTLEKEIGLSGYRIDSVEYASKKTWHGIAAAYYVKQELGITDIDILNAIRYHTVGRAHMSKLEKIVYLGDLVSAERDYPDVEKYRQYALDDLDNGMYKALKWLINDFTQSGRAIPLCTVEAYNCYLNATKK